MAVITSRKELIPVLERIRQHFENGNEKIFLESIQNELLKKKIKFPILEFATREILSYYPKNDVLNLTDKIIGFHETGSNVMAGIVLQERLEKHLKQSVDKALEYILEGNEWYCCDIISERVMGYGLLNYPDKMIPVFKKLSKEENNWKIRSVGVATHYAVKKGLDDDYVEEMFKLLLSLSETTEYHSKTGIGWGAKTVAKFHPSIIEKYKDKLVNDKSIRQWFKHKIEIGLKIGQYKFGNNLLL